MPRGFKIVLPGLAIALALGASAPAYAAKPAAAPAAKAKAADAEAEGEKMSFDELHLHVGKRIIVHTTFNTVRTGILTQVSNSQLTLGLESGGSLSELTMPRSTIVSVALAATQPAPQSGTPSAQKN